MNPLLIALVVALSAVFLLLVLQFRKLSSLSRLKEGEWQPILNNFDVLKKGQEMADRAVRDEMSRNRQESATHSQSLRGEVVSGLTQISGSIDQKLELVRSGVDERHSRLQTVVDTQLTTINQQTGQKLSDLERALRNQAQQLRDETNSAFKTLGDSVLKTLTGISEMQKTEVQDLKKTVDTRLSTIQIENEKKLEQMRQTVDEKLQGTLESRLGESFKQVSDRLEQVYRGLGEMQSLASGVGDLKRVLTNVKTRGTWGEVQLGAILEQILAPDQYAQNVATSGTGERVEYAVKLPGRDSKGDPVWLPIDAKFPIEDYQRLMDASERADAEGVEKAARQLETRLKGCAADISNKYVLAPYTTDFGILFLSTEGLYAEAMRRVGLSEFIQREYRIILAGPSTLAALLNSLQMGFRTLAIQQRSSEVWELLGAVKSEFGKYADMLAKVKKKLTEAQNTVERAETRTRAINKKLRDVESTDGQGLIDEADEIVDESELVLA